MGKQRAGTKEVRASATLVAALVADISGWTISGARTAPRNFPNRTSGRFGDFLRRDASPRLRLPPVVVTPGVFRASSELNPVGLDRTNRFKKCGTVQSANK
jgi:hypothetical protein